MAKLSASVFAQFLLARCAAKDGYIMGARGENPRKWQLGRWPYTQYSGKQLTQAKKWREKCERVWDCQGAAEGYINEETGSNIDTRARNNYATWCDPKGKGVIPAQHRKPGAAVFKAYDDGTIHHIGFLVEPVKESVPGGDWYIVEAKGVMYGVVCTKLSDGGWNRWGLMTKYFDYGAVDDGKYAFSERPLGMGCDGDDVKELQSLLLELGYDLGKWGCDGEFGKKTLEAVKAFQKAFRIAVDGVINDDDFDVLRDASEADDPDEPEPSYVIDCIDLSSHNAAQEPKIDWEKIKAQVAFLILRSGCTRRTTKPLGIGPDAYHEKWATACEAHGIPYWDYHYSQMASEADARAEARHMIKVSEGHNPVGYALDAEIASIKRANILAWADEMRKLTDKPIMLYQAHHLVPTFDLPVDDDGFAAAFDADWKPRYGKNDGTFKDKYLPAYSCDLWQGTSVYELDGIPDKTIDANRVTGQRHTVAWFRGEE